MSEAIEPYVVNIAEEQLEDLRRRLENVRWPDRETPNDWSQGIPLAYMRQVCDYWRSDYDWRRWESKLNGFAQFKTTIDGLGIHFLHVRSPHANALPLIITHGWPGSVVEFHKIIGPLTDPIAHGGNAKDAFHVICPSLPGFGFSDKPDRPGWDVNKIGHAWGELMRRLGYDRYVAQGGDWGAMVTSSMGQTQTDHCAGIHINMPIVAPDPETMNDLTPQEQSALEGMTYYNEWDSGYSKQQSTRPQTVGYGLADSPSGQAAWILEKFWAWTDCGEGEERHPENVLSRDELLDNVMMYWLTESAASSARLYWESFNQVNMDPITIPVGCSIFPKEIFRSSRRWAEKRFTQLIHWNELSTGGHFAAFEQPEIFVKELRDCFRQLRRY
ncbi:MAG: epoxide hydrolase family protein [Pseudomonadales bacterium]